jgi:hypothetical protein
LPLPDVIAIGIPGNRPREREVHQIARPFMNQLSPARPEAASVAKPIGCVFRRIVERLAAFARGPRRRA